MKVYLLPGLGFDEQIFSKLNLEDFDIQYINWIEPVKNEPIQQYAKRMAEPIDDQADRVVLIGHSFGGMISQEIACFKIIHKIIIISSIKSRAELPFHFKIVRPLFLYKLFTKQVTIKTVKYWGKTHDYNKGEEQEVFKSMVNKQSNNYLQWALKTLSEWQTPEVPKNTQIIHIHGGRDKTLPIRTVKEPDYTIEGGGHFMVFKRYNEINDILKRELNH